MDFGLAVETTYYYRVRAFNGAGTSGWSGVATVRVLPLPTLTGARLLPDGGFRLLVQGHPGKRYAIERSTNMINWSAVTTVTNGSDSTPIYYADSGTNSAPRRYYRARVVP